MIGRPFFPLLTIYRVLSLKDLDLLRPVLGFLASRKNTAKP